MKENLYQFIELLRVLAVLLKELLVVAKEILKIVLSFKDSVSPEQFKTLIQSLLAWLEARLEAVARQQKEPRMYMQNVMDHLHISERTYYRKVKEGKLVPRRWEGRDYFYESDLEEQLKESQRRGRI